MAVTVNVVPGPQRTQDTAMRRIHRWVVRGLIPAPADWRTERGTVAAALVLFQLHDWGGIRCRATLRSAFAKLTDGPTPLVDALLADAEEGSPVCVVTYWCAPDGRSGTSIVFKLTADLDDPILAPGNEWEPLTEGVLSLAPLFDKLLDSAVLPFRARGAV